MPYRSVYIRAGDESLWERAGKLAGNLTEAITQGLRLYVAQHSPIRRGYLWPMQGPAAETLFVAEDGHWIIWCPIETAIVADNRDRGIERMTAGAAEVWHMEARIARALAEAEPVALEDLSPAQEDALREAGMLE